MNNEPVAWMLVTGHGTKILEKKPYCQIDYWKPLYTHPAKTLTNDEIREVLMTNPAMAFQVAEIGISKENIEWFARAILRKAQEK